MIQIKPYMFTNCSCSCGGDFSFSELIWQGLHTCEKLICTNCGKVRINSLEINQSGIEPYIFYPGSELICDHEGNVVPDNWFSKKLKCLANPVIRDVDLEIEIINKFDSVLILNTLDYIYGHSFLYLLNLQRIIKSEKELGIIVIIQPMLRWLIPEKNVAEIWTVDLGFRDFNNFYPDLSAKINSELARFKKVMLSKAYVIPTNENINIQAFTGIKPYNFLNEPSFPSITFIWREDPDRLWIRNFYLLKGFKKAGLGKLLIPFQYLRVIYLFRLLRRTIGTKFTYSVAGLGDFGNFPSYIRDLRVKRFTEDAEKMLCEIYSESTLVIGIHGSGMLLPSAHAGMTVSLMPSKRWGNFAEDILFTEKDIRLASFQRRIVPLNLSVFEIRDIIADMVRGRKPFIQKFIHTENL
jgi:hypothetical protein